MSRLKRLIQEVHRRSLWQLLASYIVGAWLVLQIAETLASLIGLPLWFGASVIALLAFGLVLVLVTGLVHVIAAVRSEPEVPHSGVRRFFSWKNVFIAGVVAVTVLAVGTAGYMGMRVMGIGPAGTLVAKGVLDEHDRIILADFEDHTGDPILALTVTEALRVDLSQSRVVSLAGPDYVANVLQRMERDPHARLSAEEALQMYSQAMRFGYSDEAIALLNGAIELDSSFALAHSALAARYYWNNDRPRGEAHFDKALLLAGEDWQKARGTARWHSCTCIRGGTQPRSTTE